jgi:predicted RNA-binding protein
MPDPLSNIVEIDVRIAIVKDNLRELVEQSASYSGAADDELMSQRIAEQEAELELLTKRRDELLSQTGS